MLLTIADWQFIHLMSPLPEWELLFLTFDANFSLLYSGPGFSKYGGEPLVQSQGCIDNYVITNYYLCNIMAKTVNFFALRFILTFMVQVNIEPVLFD